MTDPSTSTTGNITGTTGTPNSSSIGYGLASAGSVRWNSWNNLHFNGDEKKYETWEKKFLGYMLLQRTW